MKPMKKIMLTMPVEVHEAIKKAADKDNRSFNNYVVNMLIEIAEVIKHE